MGTDVKVIRKLSAQIQAGATFEDGAMQLIPLLSGFPMQTFDPIDNEAISGEAFRDIPQQGNRHVAGSFSMNLDKTSIQTILEAASGTTGPYTFGTNTKKLSLVGSDQIKTNEYANVYVKRLAINGSENGILTADVDIVGVTAEDRQALSHPSSTAYDADPFTFPELGGTNGYVRAGDDTDALASGDNLEIESFSLEIITGFDEQFYNARGTLTPVFGMVPPSVTGSFVVSRHDTDQWQTWAEGHESLQMNLLAYKSATAQFLIEIPRFIAKPEVTDEDVNKINVEQLIGRNGVTGTVVNSNMNFVSPIRFTVTDS